MYSEEIKTPCEKPDDGWRVVDRSIYSMVTHARYTLAELSRIEKELREEHRGQVLYSSADEYSNRVKLELYVVTDELRKELNTKYGAGVVQLYGWLEPVK